MRLWLAGAFAAVSLITAFAVYLFGDNKQALVVAVLIGVLAGFLIAVAITHRVSRLAQAANEMASGSFDAPLRVGARDEIHAALGVPVVTSNQAAFAVVLEQTGAPATV